ncbi:bifunctional phosphopantothenoylcysteine decarboxylase/phosphopantothenate--cysteine ligase CoaBC [Lujinxingia litoralis]|uniref:Coenzyme A biosynthesis bifunctional protein CoaBC n=1 Tax=Lujinxingia litoralis TaxID=2211119 RepID=A0A328C2B7_9DELT|nr:bifunctional phosphopantothenoylcysteine decarboxylase/phosphopantothenate--cysteine ligase CoaBC [Lujinxingia litoralis]RAL20792.1 bifunctional phosphopantothenoylcysteine decarboxylase/phosphopantothenate--cysteine ligase CoaBC [Lujinxingia litoralis]
MALNVVLGVSGGIAAYKACELARALIKRGDEVRVVMTRNAREFVSPLTFQALTQAPVGLATFDPGYEAQIGHIELARWADVVLVAPATANLVAKMAHGLADDLLTTVLLATRAPVVVAPAMNTQMYLHPRVQANLTTLSQTPGYRVIAPDHGELACKEVGPGRLPDPPVILAELDRALSPQLLAGKRVLLSAGPTRERIDAARFLSNPSSGKMGYALAAAAREMGAEVTLVSGPVALEAPYGVDVIGVESAVEMHGEVMARAPESDVVMMVAAVADWRPAVASQAKLEKSSMEPVLELTRNPDILAELGERFGPGSGATEGPILVGFAAESHDVVARGRAKAARKGVHALVANAIGGPAGAFGADESTVHVLVGAQEARTHRGPKSALARAIWQDLAGLARG